MTCTHGAPHMIHDTGARCPWCLSTIATDDVPRTVVNAACDTGTGSVGALVGSRVATIAPEVCGPPAPATSGVSTDRPTEAGADATASRREWTPAPGSPLVSDPGAHRGARNTDPDTSLEAAQSITDEARRDVYARIIRIIFEHGPQTDWQLGQRLGLLATSAGKRRGEMRDMGLVVRTEFRGPTATGPKKGWRWALTDAGSREVAA